MDIRKDVTIYIEDGSVLDGEKKQDQFKRFLGEKYIRNTEMISN